MASPDPSSTFDDVQKNVRQFNDDEAVWRFYLRRRARRKPLPKLPSSLNARYRLPERELDELDWFAAEREAKPIRAVGTWIAP